MENVDSADTEENDLLNLDDGAPIEVEFRDAGWLPATFRGFVSGSGNVRFERNGVTRISAARFVRRRAVQ